MVMGDLSLNFSRHEFVCMCGCGYNQVAPQLVESLQQLRDLAGCPVIVTSGLRCESHNRKVGGHEHSYHIYGMAADVTFGIRNVDAMARLAEEVPRFEGGGIGRIYSGNAIHVDIRPWRARWSKGEVP